jgi:hypothetical protein
MIVTPTQDDLYTKLGAFVALLVPAGTIIVQGQVNRVPSPAGANWVLMQTILTRRLSTNVDNYDDPDPLPGTRARQQSVELSVQFDFYGPSAQDSAVMFSTMWRDDFGCDNLAPTCQPLYADEAKQAPLMTGEQQYLQRWTVTAALQYNAVTSTPQDFAGELSATLENVDVSYPP